MEPPRKFPGGAGWPPFTVLMRTLPLFGLGITQVAYSTVYLWTLEGLIIGSIAIGVLVWILQWTQ